MNRDYFDTSYRLQVRVGLPLAHNPNSNCSVCWRYCNAGLTNVTWTQVASQLDDYAANACKLRTDYYAQEKRRSSSTLSLQRVRTSSFTGCVTLAVVLSFLAESCNLACRAALLHPCTLHAAKLSAATAKKSTSAVPEEASVREGASCMRTS